MFVFFEIISDKTKGESVLNQNYVQHSRTMDTQQCTASYFDILWTIPQLDQCFSFGVGETYLSKL